MKKIQAEQQKLESVNTSKSPERTVIKEADTQKKNLQEFIKYFTAVFV